MCIRDRRKACGEPLDDEIIQKVSERRLKDEIQSGIQTIQYQLITLMTCNGQAPFVTIFMYLDEVPEGRTRDDLALIIEEVMKQRMQGVKNERGAWITPASVSYTHLSLFPRSGRRYHHTHLHRKSKLPVIRVRFPVQMCMMTVSYTHLDVYKRQPIRH